MRLIDADLFLTDISNRLVRFANDLNLGMEERIKTLAGIANLFYGQPTVDAVPVVRCKDCRFINRCSHNPFNGNFYCADGERKEAAEE